MAFLGSYAIILVAPSIGLTTAEEREEREELELELGLLNTLELGRPEELELELGRPEELGLPEGDTSTLEDD